MIFISAAAVIFLVRKFKEIDWAKTCVLLPDEEEDHERYFLSEQPQSKVVDESTPQMVRSVSNVCVLAPKRAVSCDVDGSGERSPLEFTTLPLLTTLTLSLLFVPSITRPPGRSRPSFFITTPHHQTLREQNSLSCVQALAFQ